MSSDLRATTDRLYRPSRRIFLHFFDVHFLDHIGAVQFERQARDEMELALKFALLLDREVLIPASSYLESDLCRQVLQPFFDLVTLGRIWLVGSGTSYLEFRDEKLRQYPVTDVTGKRYRKIKKIDAIAWKPRLHSATADISADWITGMSDELAKRFTDPTVALPVDFLNRWESVPAMLAGRAFIVDNAIPILFERRDIPKRLRNRLHDTINESYVGSYTEELTAGIFRNLNFLGSGPRLISGDPNADIDYVMCLRVAQESELLRPIKSCRKGPELFRLAQAWRTSVEKASTSDPFNPTFGSTPTRLADVAILTIIPEEFKAVRARLPDAKRVPGTETLRNSYAWHLADIPCVTGGHYRVVTAMFGRQGTSSAAAATTLTAMKFYPYYIILVGIAGGFAKDNLTFGDVVISDPIYGYEYAKIREEIEIRPKPTFAPDNALLTSALDFRDNSLNTWKGLGHSPKVLTGPIASGDKLVDNCSHPFFQSVSDKFPSLLAVEMEGAGAGEAGHHLHASGNHIGLIMVRGISDMPPGIGGTNQTETRDKWKQPAADAAAEFVVQWIANGLPISARR